MTADQQTDLADHGAFANLTQSDIRISQQLLEARATLSELSGFPGNPPVSLAKAYQIQERSIAQWPDKVVGWKVGGIPSHLQQELGAEWLVGPIFSSHVRFAKAGEIARMPIFVSGFAAVEPEFVIEIGASRDEDRMFIGAEIASSPVPDINSYGPTAVVCDFGNNNGLLVGQEITGWSSIMGPVDVSIALDGELVGTRALENLSEQAVTARDFCLDHAEQQGRTLEPGTFISTGAITGVHEAMLGARGTISFGDLGDFDLELISETGKSMSVS